VPNGDAGVVGSGVGVVGSRGPRRRDVAACRCGKAAFTFLLNLDVDLLLGSALLGDLAVGMQHSGGAGTGAESDKTVGCGRARNRYAPLWPTRNSVFTADLFQVRQAHAHAGCSDHDGHVEVSLEVIPRDEKASAAAVHVGGSVRKIDNDGPEKLF
jgi:hypothetical protein